VIQLRFHANNSCGWRSRARGFSFIQRSNGGVGFSDSGLRPGLYRMLVTLCYTICVDFSDESDISKPTKMRGLERDSSLYFVV
jgi:hypothetical protein